MYRDPGVCLQIYIDAHVYAQVGLLREINLFSRHWFSVTKTILYIFSEDSILVNILNFINLVYILPGNSQHICLLQKQSIIMVFGEK